MMSLMVPFFFAPSSQKSNATLIKAIYVETCNLDVSIFCKSENIIIVLASSKLHIFTKHCVLCVNT